MTVTTWIWIWICIIIFVLELIFIYFVVHKSYRYKHTIDDHIEEMNRERIDID